MVKQHRPKVVSRFLGVLALLLFPDLSLLSGKKRGYLFAFRPKKFLVYIARNLKSRLDRFKVIQLDPVVAKKLLPTIYLFEKPLAIIEMKAEAFSYYRAWVFEIGAFLIAVFNTYIYKVIYLESQRVSPRFTIAYHDPLNVFWVSLVTYLFLRIFLRVADYISKQISLSTRIIVFSLLLIGLMISLVSLTWKNQVISLVEFQAFSILTGLITSIIFTFISIFVDHSVYNAYSYMAESRYPEAVFVHILVMIISEIVRNPKEWNSFQMKKWILFKLEMAAEIIERFIYGQLQSKNPGMREWIKKAGSVIAAGIRDKEKHILLTRGPEAKKKLIKELEQILVTSARGNWGDLPGVEGEAEPVRKSWQNYLLSTLRMILIGGGPLALLLATGKMGLVLAQPYNDYAIVGAILWALLTVILTFDPQLPDKINALKELRAMARKPD